MSVLFTNQHFLFQLIPRLEFNDALNLWRVSVTISNVMQYQVLNLKLINSLYFKNIIEKVMQEYIKHGIGPQALNVLNIQILCMSFGSIEAVRRLETWSMVHRFVAPKFCVVDYSDCIRYNFNFIAKVGSFQFLMRAIYKVCFAVCL